MFAFIPNKFELTVCVQKCGAFRRHEVMVWFFGRFLRFTRLRDDKPDNELNVHPINMHNKVFFYKYK